MTAARWRRGYSASPTTTVSIFFGAGACEEAETAAAEPDFVAPHELSGARVGPAIEHLVLNLPPKERACAPQGCLRLFARGNRGARRLNGRRRESGPQPGPIEIGVFERTIRSRAGRHPRIKRSALYVERFNRQDWDGLAN